MVTTIEGSVEMHKANDRLIRRLVYVQVLCAAQLVLLLGHFYTYMVVALALCVVLSAVTIIQFFQTITPRTASVQNLLLVLVHCAVIGLGIYFIPHIISWG